MSILSMTNLNVPGGHRKENMWEPTIKATLLFMLLSIMINLDSSMIESIKLFFAEVIILFTF